MQILIWFSYLYEDVFQNWPKQGILKFFKMLWISGFYFWRFKKKFEQSVKYIYFWGLQNMWILLSLIGIFFWKSYWILKYNLNGCENKIYVKYIKKTILVSPMLHKSWHNQKPAFKKDKNRNNIWHKVSLDSSNMNLLAYFFPWHAVLRK